jgi:4-hydroxy-3-polyprenylbenzoate decarboxylase
MDTLDYSGDGWNAGSKVVIACCGDKKRELKEELPNNFSLPEGFSNPKFVQPGILAIQGNKFEGNDSYNENKTLTEHLQQFDLQHIPMILLVDDSDFVTETLNNFLWVGFTRVNPSHDIHGVDAFVQHKHWGCRGPIVMDARIKPHHAPPLVRDKATQEKVDKLFAQGGELYGVLG